MLRTYHDKWRGRKLAFGTISLCLLIFPAAAKSVPKIESHSNAIQVSTPKGVTVNSREVTRGLASVTPGRARNRDAPCRGAGTAHNVRCEQRFEEAHVPILPAPFQGALQFHKVPGVTLAKPRVTSRLFTMTPCGVETWIPIHWLWTFDTAASALRQDVPPSINASSAAEIADDAAKVNCKDSTRINSVRELWQKMGADPSEISVEKSGTTQNLVLRKKAPIETAETIVLGAHYDKTAAGCGAIDNWTGIVAISHIFSTVKNLPLKKNLIFVAFGNEEQGLLGSRAMIKAATRDDLDHFCAMINVDSLGMTSPAVVPDLSSKPLTDATLEIARASGIKAGTIDLPGAGADSLPFIEKNIPAVTIVGLDRQWRQILHTGFDQASRVKMPEVHEGYKLALNLLLKVEKMDCHSFASSRRNR